MPGEPLYPKVVVGVVDGERGEDALALGERIVEADGGQLTVVHSAHGSPAKPLREMAERGQADLIVLGSTHRAALGAVAPGSVAEHLLKGTPSRLVIAPKGFARAVSGEEGADADLDSLPYVRDELRVIAVGFDGSVSSRSALAEAAVLAGRFGATIRVIAVTSPQPQASGPAAPDPHWELQGPLHDAVAELPRELRAQPIHEHGDAVEKLLERAGEGVDLLMLGSRGFGAVLRVMVGSVSAKVIREAPCAVMIVPSGGSGTPVRRPE